MTVLRRRRYDETEGGSPNMSRYLLIETKDPLDGGDYSFELGKQLRKDRHEVSLYLLQDAVLAARRGFRFGESLLTEAKSSGLTVLADEISLRERGVSGERLSREVRTAGMTELVELLMEGSEKAIWH